MHRGDVVAGRFELERLAGEGGMGVVYRARDRESDKPVALKLIRRLEADTAARFLREARVLARLSHPRIVRYIGVVLWTARRCLHTRT